ncbi:LOW QUALITY PROTEIN: hypothetical protein M514_13935, partial [Trichuris suis]
MKNITDFFCIPKFGDEDVALRDILELPDIAYLADLCEKFNAMNLQLQVGNLNLVKTKSAMEETGVRAFVSKLGLYKRNCRCLDPCDQDIEVYWEQLEMLHEDLKRRFREVLSMAVPNWVIEPFASDDDAELHLQGELVDLHRDCVMHMQHFSRRSKYQLYIRVFKRLLIAFSSSPLVERCFSVVTDLLTKKRSRLQVVNRGDLRLRVTGIEPDIEKLVRSHGRHDSS